MPDRDFPVAPGRDSHEHLFQTVPSAEPLIQQALDPPEVKLEHVMSEDRQWWSPNAQSVKDMFAEMQLITVLHSSSALHKADDAWLATLLPLSQWVVQVATGEHLFVCAARSVAALAWPGRERAGLLQFDDSISELKWLVCTDLSQYQVQPVATQSPWRSCLAGRHKGIDSPLAVCDAVQGKPLSVLEFQARHGFAGVPEASVNRLLRSLALLDDSEDETSSLLRLMRTFWQDMTPLDARKALRLRDQHAGATDVGIEVNIDEGMVRDLLSESDKKVVQEYLQETSGSSGSSGRDEQHWQHPQ